MYYTLDGYRLFHKVRKNKRGGGLFLFVKNNIHVETHDISFENFEGLNCTLKTNDVTINVL
jgi:hypothetical protein